MLKLNLKNIIFLLAFIKLINGLPAIHKVHMMNKTSECDDAVNKISLDWDGTDDQNIPAEVYSCFISQSKIKVSVNQHTYPQESCETPLESYHICTGKAIKYTNSVPLSGAHRPIWPTYGEYTYLPPQRWVHSLEHGAAVFLYDPCADKVEINTFKELARLCLRRHIITPYNKLPGSDLFNVLTFGCKLQLNKIVGHEDTIVQYLVKHAIKDGPERAVYSHGLYKFGLVNEAKTVSDLQDSNVCPKFPHKDDDNDFEVFTPVCKC